MQKYHYDVDFEPSDEMLDLLLNEQLQTMLFEGLFDNRTIDFYKKFMPEDVRDTVFRLQFTLPSESKDYKDTILWVLQLCSEDDLCFFIDESFTQLMINNINFDQFATLHYLCSHLKLNLYLKIYDQADNELIDNIRTRWEETN